RSASVDTAQARSAAGVVEVLSGADLGTDPVPGFMPGTPTHPRTALATDKVRFAGEPVALVVAQSRAAATDAAELVDVDYDDLPAVTDPEEAVSGQAPLQFEEQGSNIAAGLRDADDPY